MTDERPFVSDAERRRHEHLSASKPTSADRVSDRLNELTAERDDALRSYETVMALYENERADLERKLAEARKPYADKIMALEQEVRELQAELLALNVRKAEAVGQVEHTTAQLHTARAERDSFQATLRQATSTLRKVRELTLPY